MGVETALIIAGTAASAAGYTAVAAGIQIAITTYGLYSANRQKKQAKAAAAAALSDRTIQVPATDMSRDIVYGERVVGGRWAYAVEPRDEPAIIDGIQRPANEYFFVVLALAVDHEIESIEDILFDGQSVGPWQGGPPFLDGSPYAVGEDSKYFKVERRVSTDKGKTSPTGEIVLPRFVSRVLTITMAEGAYPADPDRPGYVEPGTPTAAPPSYVTSFNVVQLPLEFANRGYTITWEYEIREPKVQIWTYRGTANQPVNTAVQAASGMPRPDGGYNSPWTSSCRLAGIPYVVVRIKPDLDMFPSGIPSISARIKGKRCLSPTWSGRRWTRNPAIHVYDYKRSVWEIPESQINLTLMTAAIGVCDTPTIYGWEEATAAAPLPQPKKEPMYVQDIVLSTEAPLRENEEMMLASMAGTSTFAGARFDIRAGAAPEIAAVSLDESDLAGPIRCKPDLGLMESFNCVRGRHVALRTIGESETVAGVTKYRTRIEYVTTDFPPYKSPTYIAEDGGVERWQDIDLPGVSSPYQAQRIAILQLRVGRNSLSFSAAYKPKVGQLSAGEVVNITDSTWGWVNKPFYLMARERLQDGTINCEWTEAAPAIFEPNWSELTQPDPSPNTRLTPVTDVSALTGLTIRSGSEPEFYEVGSDGLLRAYAIASWDRSTSAGVLYGGRIELQYKYGDKSGWENAPLMAGDATSFRIPVARGQQIAVMVRPMSVAQVYGPWSTEGHHAANAPEAAISGNLLTNAEFAWATQVARPDPAYNSPLYVLDWSNPRGASPDGTSWNPGGYAPGFDPVVSTVANGVGGFDTQYLGIAGWIDIHANGFPIQYVESKPVEVKPGRRLVAFADNYTTWGRAFLGVMYFMSDGTRQAQYFDYAPYHSNQGAGTRLEYYRRIYAFFDAIPGCLQVALILGYYREIQLPNGNNALSYWHRPFLGYASPGQILLPPWSK
jgi:hypothetical protein